MTKTSINTIYLLEHLSLQFQTPMSNTVAHRHAFSKTNSTIIVSSKQRTNRKRNVQCIHPSRAVTLNKYQNQLHMNEMICVTLTNYFQDSHELLEVTLFHLQRMSSLFCLPIGSANTNISSKMMSDFVYTMKLKQSIHS